MLNINVDENGNQTNEIEDKINIIKDQIDDFFKKLLKEKEENELRSKPQPIKFGYRLSTKLASIVRSFPMKTPKEIDSIEYEDINDYFKAYIELIAYFNEEFDFPSNKQDFCALMGITVANYNKWFESDKEEVVNLMQSIDDYFNGLAFQAGEAGNLNDRATLARMKIKDAGQGMVENNFEATVTIQDKCNDTPMELERKMNRILGEVSNNMLKEAKKTKKRSSKQ